MIDLLLALVLVGYALSGYRQGAVVGLLSIGGFLGGAALAMWGLPRLIDDTALLGDSTSTHAVLLVAGVLLAAVAGQTAATAVGVRLRHGVSDTPFRVVDRVLGAVAGVVAVSLLVWLIAGALRGGPSPVLSRAIGQSRVIAAIDAAVPSDTGRVFAGFRDVLDAGGFPRVFAGFGPETIRPAAPPDVGAGSSPGVRAAVRGIVKINGDAVTCSRSQEGTGWVLADDVVVTNAHVVAAVDRPRVRVGGVGRGRVGQVVLFDPVRDLAVLRVPGLSATPLTRAADLTDSDSAVVAGFPLNGPYQVVPARVRDVLTARGEDIYGRRTSVREVYSLFTRVQPGNSGGPLLDTDGRVVGVIFAKSLDDPDTGYALTMHEARSVLDRGLAATTPVSTGGCAAA